MIEANAGIRYIFPVAEGGKIRNMGTNTAPLWQIIPAEERPSYVDVDNVLCWRVSEKRINRFCGNCDNLQSDNSCALIGRNNQGKAVIREWCDQASIDGDRIYMDPQ